jgi:hypothetical protein
MIIIRIIGSRSIGHDGGRCIRDDVIIDMLMYDYDSCFMEVDNLQTNTTC